MRERKIWLQRGLYWLIRVKNVAQVTLQRKNLQLVGTAQTITGPFNQKIYQSAGPMMVDRGMKLSDQNQATWIWGSIWTAKSDQQPTIYR